VVVVQKTVVEEDMVETQFKVSVTKQTWPLNQVSKTVREFKLMYPDFCVMNSDKSM
jgi:hypothetical protein